MADSEGGLDFPLGDIVVWCREITDLEGVLDFPWGAIVMADLEGGLDSAFFSHVFKMYPHFEHWLL